MWLKSGHWNILSATFQQQSGSAISTVYLSISTVYLSISTVYLSISTVYLSISTVYLWWTFCSLYDDKFEEHLCEMHLKTLLKCQLILFYDTFSLSCVLFLFQPLMQNSPVWVFRLLKMNDQGSAPCWRN